MEHELKTDPEHFEAVRSGDKKFELRRNDRDFGCGDTLRLRETRRSGRDMARGAPLEYTGREYRARVTCALHGPVWGLAEGWVIMSIEPVTEADHAAH